MPFRSSGRGAYGPQGQRVLKGPLAPVWVTFSPPAAGAGAYSYQFVATDDSGDAPTYSLASGSVPTGLTLSSSGLLSGTPTASGTFTFNVRATDVNGRFTDSGNVSIVVSLVLYEFTTVTFNAGTAGTRTGPSLSAARSGLTGTPSPSNWSGTYLNMTTNGIMRWTVPATGNYRIIAAGASGGDNPSAVGNRGRGAIMRGTFAFTQGDVLQILVGQRGGDHGSTNHAGSGGGGTYVVTSGNSPLIVAGGGGGGGNVGGNVANAVTSQDGQNATASNGGTGGNGSTSFFDSNPPGGGGGGFFSSGANAPGFSSDYARGGAGFLQGGEGGAGNNSSGYARDGGFGGGASAYGGGGGGGGYSGGGGGRWSPGYYGGGGGSINNGSSQDNTAGAQDGNGYVTITRL